MRTLNECHENTWNTKRVQFNHKSENLDELETKPQAHLLAFYDIKLHSLSVPDATKIFPWVVLLNGGLDTTHKQSENTFPSAKHFYAIMVTIKAKNYLVHKDIFLGVIPAKESQMLIIENRWRINKHAGLRSKLNIWINNSLLVQARSGFVST